ncbi:hypothetical protein EBR21_03490 [bacterium]|nr:hypothetical protein [bacterium]
MDAAQAPLKTLFALRPFGLVCLVTLGLTIWQVSWNRLGAAYISALRGQEVANPPFSLVGRNLLLAGILGGIVGLVHTTKNLTYSDKIGHPIYFSIASISYASIGYLFLVLLFDAITEKSETERNETNPKGKSILKILFFALLMSVSVSLIDTPRGEALHLTPFYLLLSSILPVAIALGKQKQRKANYFMDAIIVAGVLSSCVGVMSSGANLADVNKAISGMYISVNSVLYAFIAGTGLRWLGKQSVPTQANEQNSNTKNLMRFAFASIGVVALISLFVAFHMIAKN